MSAPQVSAPNGRPDGDGWRRVHWVTPLLRSWQGLVVVLVVLFSQFPDADWMHELAQEGIQHITLVAVLLVLVALLLVAAVAVGWLFLAWNMTRFRITEESLELYRGVVFKQHRTARLDRLQAVNISQPFLARIVGLARLKLEVAGGADSNISLEFLSEDDARSLRNHLLARAAGLSYDTPEAPEAPAGRIAALPTDRLVRSVLVSGSTLGFFVLVLASLVLAIGSRSIGAIFVLVPGLFGAGSVLWNRFTRGFDFTLDSAEDGLRVHSGLLEKQSLTVAPGRIQAVEVDQPLIWRRFGWWRIRVNIAGNLRGQRVSEETTGVVHPAATLDEVRAILPYVVPYLAVEAAGAGGYDLLTEGLNGSGEGAGYVTSPRRARLFDPLQWRRTGFAATGSAILIRHGRLRRAFVVVPHERTQSLGLYQGPLLRRRGLATVGVHSTPGPVTPRIHRLDAAVAQQLVIDQTERARVAREHARPERWMEAYTQVLQARQTSAPLPQPSAPLQQPAEAAQPSRVEELPPPG